MLFRSVNRVALGLITLSLAGCGGFYLLFAVTKGKGGRAWDASFKGLLFLLLAAMVGAEGFGLSVASWFKNLNRFVGIQIESMDEDVRKLRRRRYPAVQIIILILTVVIYILAVNRLMSSG